MTWRNRRISQAPHQHQRGDEHEQHVDEGARADRRDERDALRRGGDAAPGLRVERGHQLALGEPHEIGAVDDLAEMTGEHGAAAREPRLAAREPEQVAHHGFRLAAIVGRDRGLGARLQVLDAAQPHQAQRLAHEDRGERRKRQRGANRAEDAEPLRARIQVLDELSGGEPEPQQDQAAQCGREQRAPRKAAVRCHRRHNRWRLGFRRLRDDDSSARGTQALVVGPRRRDYDLRIVETERGGFSGRVAHENRSPSRNCSARSRRMWGRPAPAPPSAAPSSSGGGRNRTKR